MPGVGRGLGWGLELGWVKIMKKQSRIDGNSKVNLEARGAKSSRAYSVC